MCVKIGTLHMMSLVIQSPNNSRWKLDRHLSEHVPSRVFLVYASAPSSLGPHVTKMTTWIHLPLARTLAVFSPHVIYLYHPMCSLSCRFTASRHVTCSKLHQGGISPHDSPYRIVSQSRLCLRGHSTFDWLFSAHVSLYQLLHPLSYIFIL